MLLTSTILISTLILTSAKGESISTAADYLLPTYLSPWLYTIELEPNFETDTFNGSIRIAIFSRARTNQIVLHAYQLTIEESSIWLMDINGAIVASVLATSYSNDDKHFYTITFRQDLEKFRRYILVIGSYSGRLNDELVGFYLAKYVDENGNSRKLATTKFEPTHARRAFPCFDEPALKANFEITIIRPAGYNSISNMPKISTTQLSENRFQDTFARTVKMSTYLVAFVISDFANVFYQNHRVFLRPSLIAKGRGNYALRTGVNVLAALAKFLDFPYALEKMDQIGLPDGYFKSGAMENWGLVTYREKNLAYANGISDSNDEQHIAETISHEFGHQWFGNLVSPAWWSYVWLNEGFARYFGYYGSSVVAKDMESMHQIVIKAVQRALLADSRGSTRPMNQKEVGSPDDIQSLFDVVAYEKSASVIRMVEGIISTEIFRRGLNVYLNKMKFQAAYPIDLYLSWQQALDEARIAPFPIGGDMISFMNTWADTAGYPLVTVERNYRDGSVVFNQRRFLAASPENDDPSLWYVPISYATTSRANFSNTTPSLWLTSRSLQQSNLNGLSPNDWIIINIQQSGFYRVNYDKENWNRISNFLNSENYDRVHKLNRAQLLDDSYALAKSGVVTFDVPLNLIRYIDKETDYIPLYAFFKILEHLDTFMSNTAQYDVFKAFILDLLDTALGSVGCYEAQTDRHVTKLNRINLLTWMDKYGEKECRNVGLLRLREWLRYGDKLRILPNMQKPLICAALRTAEPKDWEFVFQQYVKEEEPLVQHRLLNSLGCSENKDILNGFMEIILDDASELKLSDRSAALSSIYNSGLFGRDYLYNFVKMNWEEVYSSLTTSERNRMIEGIASQFTTSEQYNDLESFGERVGQSFGNALSKIQMKIDWAENYLASALKWFDENL